MPVQPSDKEEADGRNHVDGHRNVSEELAAHGQKDDDARGFDGAEAGGQAEEDHPYEEETHGFLCPWQGPPNRRPETWSSTVIKIPPQATPAATSASSSITRLNDIRTLRIDVLLPQ